MVQAMVLACVLGCAIYLYSGRPDRDWYVGRAVAESAKTITWRYMSRAEPFDNSDPEDLHSFGLTLKAIVDQNKEVSGRLTTHLAAPAISDFMQERRNNNADDRLAFYREHRVVEQLQWYAKKSSDNKKKMDRYFLALLLTIGLTIALAIARVAYPAAPYWPTDFFVTLAATLLSWIQAKRYQELSSSYALTAHEIALIRQQSAGPMTDAQLSRFVRDAENAFSREHTQWVARKDS